MQTRLARNAGFCAGVRRAVKIAEEAAQEGGRWYSLGPLVHNDAVVDNLKGKGIIPVNRLEEIQVGEDAGVIIRSHGVPPETIEQARQRGLGIKDATCPLVTRVHEIVASLRGEGYEIVVFGDASHPEVKAITGWCDNQARVIASVDEACQLQVVDKLGVVSQTTKDGEEFYAVVNALLPLAKEIRVFNTICSATQKRQQAAREISLGADLIIVLGDPKSSNTATLARECKNTGVKTLQIRDASEIPADCLSGVSAVAITAGASTPDWIIKEVLDRMTEFEEKSQQELEQEATSEQDIKKEEETTNEVVGAEEAVGQPANEEEREESFAKMEAEMADFETPGRGDIIKGTVIQVQDDEVMVDVGGKSEGIIPLREMSLKDVNSAKELVNVGDEIEVMVLKWDDDGSILLSKKKVDTQKVLDKLSEDFNAGSIVEGTVTGTVKGGLLVDVGMVAFLPASHVEDGYVKNLEQYIGKTLQFKIIEFNRNKRRGSQIVLSRKELVAEEKNRLKKEFWENIEEGQTRPGRVKRIVDYGAFIDLGGYEGLLHVSEMEHRRVEHPSDILNEGDEIDVYILALDHEKERVSLSRKKLLKSPWEIAQEKYHEGDIVEGTVVRIAPFGAFVELDPGVDGLVHISQMANYRVEKPEDVVSVNEQINIKIISIDPEDKRIGLSIKQVQEEEEATEVQQYLEEQDNEEVE
ncbi:MAG: bifunctional 4-hydroxy-3-methylbut-2-enyl diphosphate reductase/30S ribosomal protein S1 [Syntrophomonadaceae bacterium]|nr:bifunctional 4-hydroxy-3-methylbut-2-enyl diphosphate reductase/30S ribosomal protein S1 [Syntrophomonadaceae bacterium]